MTSSRALKTSAMLERRAAAGVRASNAARKRADAAAADERRRSRAVRECMGSESVWPSELCSMVERRTGRTRGTLHDLARLKASAKRSGEAHEEQRRRWARVARGLERRIARAADQEPAWLD